MDKDTIHIALENLREATGIEARWEDNGQLDGRLRFAYNNKEHVFAAMVKTEPRNHHLQNLEEYLNRPEAFILVAKRIFPNIKERLRRREIPYLEANGNIFLKNGGLFLYVDTQKEVRLDNGKANRAFTKTGLKVLFYLLQHKDAIDLTQRELAEKTGVALGNIPLIINGLKELGHLIPLNDKTFVWDKRNELLDRWITAYATVLRPKLKKERFTLNKPWQDLQFDNQHTVWGGEAAADMLTDHLRPERFLIYTRENRLDLIKKHGLIPHENGEMEAIEMFWKQNDGQTAPPLLVYADLMLEGGKRNTETAKLIYDAYIKPNL